MIYKNTNYNQKIKIFNEEFVSNNMIRAKIFINNKQYDLKENIQNEKQIFKVEIKFIDNILNCIICLKIAYLYILLISKI